MAAWSGADVERQSRADPDYVVPIVEAEKSPSERCRCRDVVKTGSAEAEGWWQNVTA